MIGKICIACSHLCISKIEFAIYICMIISLYQNAGLITIIYPFGIFGWALLEETRPTPTFWKYLKYWTAIVMVIKFFYNIHWNHIMDNASHTNSDFVNVNVKFWKGLFDHASDKIKKLSLSQGYLKLGLFKYTEINELVWYVIPEVVILCLLMINSIYLRLIGYKNQSELDIENVTEAIDRILFKGDT